MVRIFDIQNGKILPSEHCFNLKSFRNIIENYPETHLKILSYVYYMTAPDPKTNPFFDVPEWDKEELIVQQCEIDFSLDEPDILEALEFAQKLYSTPTSRAYLGMKAMLDKLSEYMYDTPIKDGKDGNIQAVVSTAKDFNKIRESFKGAFQDLASELDISARGGQELGYDQL